MGIWSAIFLARASTNKFCYDPLNLCNLRNLWILNLQDLGIRLLLKDHYFRLTPAAATIAAMVSSTADSKNES
jgi:hypothetical protein